MSYIHIHISVILKKGGQNPLLCVYTPLFSPKWLILCKRLQNPQFWVEITL